MSTREEVLESNEAKLILNSDVFKKAIKQLHEEYIQLWLQSNQDEKAFRESMHAAVKLLPEIEKHLRIIVEKGKITQTNLRRIRKVMV
tara:strand:+ start:378 stop:641 length:264 start_codon:yes stop_codon:yes gene_type:complete